MRVSRTANHSILKNLRIRKTIMNFLLGDHHGLIKSQKLEFQMLRREQLGKQVGTTHSCKDLFLFSPSEKQCFSRSHLGRASTIHELYLCLLIPASSLPKYNKRFKLVNE